MFQLAARPMVASAGIRRVGVTAMTAGPPGGKVRPPRSRLATFPSPSLLARRRGQAVLEGPLAFDWPRGHACEFEKGT